MPSFYWVYDLPSWEFGAGTVAVFVALSLLALYPTRRWVRRQHRADHSHNEIVGFYLAAITVFYGITLGLVAVGTWTTFSEVGNKVSHEAETLSSLYRDVGDYPEPTHTELQTQIRDYTKAVIEVGWPMQRRGLVPPGQNAMIDQMTSTLTKFEPQTRGQEILHAEAFKQFNNLIEARRARLNSVTVGMPSALWTLVVLGAAMTIIVSLFFDLASFSMHFWMTSVLAGFLGLMVFLIGTLDNPFRGDVSVGPEAIIEVYKVMLPTKIAP